MLIGQDFDKIEFSLWGLDFLEPNALIGDFLLLIVAFLLAYKTKKLSTSLPFFRYWRAFYLAFGIGMFFGGLGHAMFNYWGFAGKYFPWYMGIISVFILEKAMISIHPIAKTKDLLNKLSLAKLILAIAAATAVFIFADLNKDQTVGLRVTAINSAVGLIYCLGILGYKYMKEYGAYFKYMWYSVFIMFPSALFIAFKINLHQWFDKNDFAHVLLIIGLILYFLSIRGYAKHLEKK
jgi:hypothetical protein